ncbi:MAG: stage III sporulation protein AB [Defluviitaleaceae bacterium]|nr:stage III sporulation protein AB [Defluviitaleaceae bacterium]
MIIRYIGGALVIGACSFLGVHIGNQGKRRNKDLLELKKSLIMLKSHLEYAIHSLPQAFYLVSERVNNPFDDFYKNMAEKLGGADANITAIWNEGINELKQGHLSKDDLGGLDMLGSALGQADVASQTNAIDMLLLTIDENLKTLHVESAKNSRMYRGLGVVSGLLITIVLL